MVLTLSENVIIKRIRPTVVNKTVNWEGFKRNLENDVNLRNALKTKHHFEEGIHNFVKSIQNLACNNTSEMPEITHGKNYPLEI